MTEKTVVGKLGEDLACAYLVSKGYRVLSRNYRKPWGEIDIVAQARDSTLVFVEVKTLKQSSEDSLAPEDHLNASKLKKFRKICQTFVSHNPDLLNERRGWRMDLVAIAIKNTPPTSGGDTSISHYENI